MRQKIIITVASAALMGLLIWRRDDVCAWVVSKPDERRDSKSAVTAASIVNADGRGASSNIAATGVLAGATMTDCKEPGTGSGATGPASTISARKGSNAGVAISASPAVTTSIQDPRPPSQFQSPASPPSVASLPRQNPNQASAAVYLKKLEEIAALGNKLSQRELDDLYAYLNLRFDAQNEMSLSEFNAVKNNILDTLLRQERLPKGLGAKLAAWSRDQNQDDLFRAYCIQHFVFYWEQRWPASGSSANDPEAAILLEAYWNATQEIQNPIAGTALAGLAHISENDSAVVRARVASKVLATALDDNCSLHSRIAAVQVCGEMGLNGVVPGARRLAESSGSIPLRLAAIAVLGQVGGVSEQSFLSGLAATVQNAILGRAIEVALLKLRDGSGTKTGVKR